jgi:hypothetical protein
MPTWGEFSNLRTLLATGIIALTVQTAVAERA